MEIEGTRLKLMVVEDNDDTANLVVKIFENLGFFTDRVADGAQAFERMKEFRPNIVVLDLELPGKTGDQIQTEMFHDPELKNVPVIVNSVHITDNSDPENLGTKYFWAHYQNTGKSTPRIVRKINTGSTMVDLIHEVAIASGETYGLIPKKLDEYYRKKSPENAPPFRVL